MLNFMHITLYPWFCYFNVRKSKRNNENPLVFIDNPDVAPSVGISGERLWMELNKIVTGNFAGSLMETMVSCDIHTYLGTACLLFSLDMILYIYIV